MNTDEQQALCLLTAYYKSGNESGVELLNWWPPTLLKTLSAQNISFDPPLHGEECVNFDLGQGKNLTISKLFTQSLLENPSEDFMCELGEFLKMSFA
jgi:hypothetical protein